MFEFCKCMVWKSGAEVADVTYLLFLMEMKSGKTSISISKYGILDNN